jgi:hypothetical protein
MVRAEIGQMENEDGDPLNEEEQLQKFVPSATSIDFFDRWLSIKITNEGMHVLQICTEKRDSFNDIIEELQEIVRSHYVAPETTIKRLEELGAPQTAKLLKEHLPTTKRARSGDLGEILATEFTERKIGFIVPVRRLRWKDGRNMALRGDDIVAIARDSKGRLKFLKGESKSRARLNSNVVKEAAVALDRDYGRPTRFSVLFVAEHLKDQEKDSLAIDLDKAVLNSFRWNSVDHLLFTFSGNDPNKPLSDHLSKCTNNVRRHAVGVCINDHGKFIDRLFSEL